MSQDAELAKKLQRDERRIVSARNGLVDLARKRSKS